MATKCYVGLAITLGILLMGFFAIEHMGLGFPDGYLSPQDRIKEVAYLIYVGAIAISLSGLFVWRNSFLLRATHGVFVVLGIILLIEWLYVAKVSHGVGG